MTIIRMIIIVIRMIIVIRVIMTIVTVLFGQLNVFIIVSTVLD